ncbi:DUF6387 family protein [Acinetobacter baumannii]|uniref:DUF6387 family protein n=1 Tax=Acinetobacter baumannii TaxID=470 RepID=UPI000A343A10|nr:DUF6387 family protein [Acinetobacter baumannii]OTS31779.1 hypothetical protein CAT07_07875 [Acinetobacter baumannii]
MALIKTISELPRWFNIKNYQRKKQTAFDFLQQVIYRKALLDFLDDPNFLIPVEIEVDEYNKNEFIFGDIPYISLTKVCSVKKKSIKYNSSEYKEMEKILHYALQKIEEDPLLEMGFGDLNYSYEFAWIYCLNQYAKKYYSYDQPPIQDVNVCDIGEKFCMLPDDIAKYLLFNFRNEYNNEGQTKKIIEFLKETNSNLNLDFLQNNYEKDDLYDLGENFTNSLSKEKYQDIESYTHKSFLKVEREVCELEHPYNIKPMISINLACNDNLIKDQFNEWLQKQRIKINQILRDSEIDTETDKSKARQSMLYKVYTYQTLAYIDLVIWSIVSDNKIKLSVLAQALFPNGAYDSDFIRKILKPLVEQLLIPSSNEILELFHLRNMEDF